MTSSRESPSGDGLNALFGDLSFDRLIAASQANSVPTPPLAAAEAPTQTHQYLSRRELRAAQQAVAAPPVAPDPVVSAPVVSTPAAPIVPPVAQARVELPQSQPTRRSRAQEQAPASHARTAAKPAAKPRSKTQYRPAQPFVRPIDSAYPADRLLVVVRHPKKIVRKRGKSFLTVLAVVGLFGSVALPAYALSPSTNLTPVDDKVAAVSLSVSDSAELDSATRGAFSATTPTDLRKQRATTRMNTNYEAYMKSGALALGDDYPYFSQLSTNQGGGLSPFNYFYRECVDFVAWRLNRDAGYLTAPYLYDWSYLTPTGGNAYQWRYAWKHHGWATSTTPAAGWVAWFSSGHVAYVKQVNGDGSVVLEEYNWQNDHLYGQRTIAANEAQLYLSPPPR